MARQVCRRDGEVDKLNRETFDLVKDAIRCQPEQVDILIAYLSVSRYLVRIADHATDVAEDVIYVIEDVITRHSADRFRSQ